MSLCSEMLKRQNAIIKYQNKLLCECGIKIKNTLIYQRLELGIKIYELKYEIYKALFNIKL